ncbi:scarecrow-like protein 21 [Selaginella moellendorffii]|nr:scarecrow-like protein 21 [Selaginella moellendorffii]|eukprot:XP_002965807.2 scarecrow-like protein 21 [Selaginella moellendorffii]
MSGIAKRRRSSRYDHEEPKSVLDLGNCISPPQHHLIPAAPPPSQQQIFRQKKLKHGGTASGSDEEFEDVFAPLDLTGDLEASLQPCSSSSLHRSSSSGMDYSIWQPEVLLSTASDDEFEMRLLDPGQNHIQQQQNIGLDEDWQNHSATHASAPSSYNSSDDTKFLEMMCSNDVFNPVQREDVLQDKIELKESISALESDGAVGLEFWRGLQHQQEQQEQQEQQQQRHAQDQSLFEQEQQQGSRAQPAAAQDHHESGDANVGIRLIQLLLACAEAVACRDVNQAATLLSQLQQMASPRGDSMQRVTSCFVEGLTARLAGLQSISLSGAAYKPAVAPPAARRSQIPEALRDEGFNLVYEFCPYFSFGHFAANAAILDAFEGESRVHIVDLGMSSALQWPALLQGLASRPGGPPESIRITGVSCDRSDKLFLAGEELSRLAESLELQFEFRAVTQAVESLQRGMLDVRDGEAMAINSAFQLHCVVKESRRSLKSVLQSIHELSPKILTLVEQDACHNGPFFLGRFIEALHYYSAIFDAVDAILPSDSEERLKIEQYHYAEEIKNIVACEGPDRVERHERADQWRRRMSRAGFQPKPLKFLGEVKTWLGMYYPSEGYTLVEEKGCIVLGWKGKPIVAASTWRC